MKLVSVIMSFALLSVAGELAQVLQRTGALPTERNKEFTTATSNTLQTATVRYANLWRTSPSNSLE